jgi:2-dehydro-3-deoxygluconokinase
MSFRFDVVALGEAMVEFNQVPQGDNRMYLQGFGGDTSNTTIAAARQGARCAYMTLVGNDVHGRMCLDLWASEGIDTGAVGVHQDAHTGVYFVHHDNSGHHFSYLRKGSAASCMRAGDLSSQLIVSAKYLHVSGISQAISTNARDTVSAAIAMARAAGVRVSYDPNLRLALWTLEEAKAAILTTIPLTDEFLPGLDELALVSGQSTPEDLVAWAHTQGAKAVVLKMGVQGVLVSDGRSVEKIASTQVNAVDATGAGDCFDGAYLARRSRGDDVFASARWAAAAAALSTQGYGAVAPLPKEQQVQAFIASGALASQP